MAAAGADGHTEFAGDDLVGVALGHEPRDVLLEVVGHLGVAGSAGDEGCRAVPQLVQEFAEEADHVVLVDPPGDGVAVLRLAEHEGQSPVEHHGGLRQPGHRAQLDTGLDLAGGPGPRGEVGPAAVCAQRAYDDPAAGQWGAALQEVVQRVAVLVRGAQHQDLPSAGLGQVPQQSADLRGPEELVDGADGQLGGPRQRWGHVVEPVAQLVDEVPPGVDLPLDGRDEQCRGAAGIDGHQPSAARRVGPEQPQFDHGRGGGSRVPYIHAEVVRRRLDGVQAPLPHGVAVDTDHLLVPYRWRTEPRVHTRRRHRGLPSSRGYGPSVDAPRGLGAILRGPAIAALSCAPPPRPRENLWNGQETDTSCVPCAIERR